MSLLIDLNDLGVRCFSANQLLHESPGVAMIDGETLLFGESALRSSRRQPLHTYTRFWSELNVAPVNSGHPRIRHHADLAYLHLKHIESRLAQEFSGERVILALSGQHDKQSLGLLLGITRQCSLEVTAIVDASLAAVLTVAQQPRLRHVELQLHQAVISDLQYQQGQLQLSDQEVLAQKGWLDLQQHLLRFFSTLFIQQTRFNPRHDAGSEQELFDQIPEYIRRCESERTLECTLRDASIRLDARLLCDEIEQWLAPLRDSIARTQPDHDLFLGDHLAHLDMFLALHRRPLHLPANQLGLNLPDLVGLLKKPTEGLRFTSGLSCKLATATTQATQLATHILFNSRAYPLAGTWSLLRDSQPPLQPGEHVEALALLRNHRLYPTDPGTITLNGVNPTHEQLLQPGDRILIDDTGPALELITVEL